MGKGQIFLKFSATLYLIQTVPIKLTYFPPYPSRWTVPLNFQHFCFQGLEQRTRVLSHSSYYRHHIMLINAFDGIVYGCILHYILLLKKKVCFVHFLFIRDICCSYIHCIMCKHRTCEFGAWIFLQKLKMLHIQHQLFKNIFHANGFILVLLSLNVVWERISFVYEFVFLMYKFHFLMAMSSSSSSPISSSSSCELLLEIAVPAKFMLLLIAQGFNYPVHKFTHSEKNSFLFPKSKKIFNKTMVNACRVSDTL